MFGPCFVIHYFSFYNHLEEEMRERIIVCLMPCDCKCSVAIPGGAWDGLQCVIVVFPDHIHLIFQPYAG